MCKTIERAFPFQSGLLMRWRCCCCEHVSVLVTEWVSVCSCFCSSFKIRGGTEIVWQKRAAMHESIFQRPSLIEVCVCVFRILVSFPHLPFTVAWCGASAGCIHRVVTAGPSVTYGIVSLHHVQDRDHLFHIHQSYAVYSATDVWCYLIAFIYFINFYNDFCVCISVLW